MKKITHPLSNTLPLLNCAPMVLGFIQAAQEAWHTGAVIPLAATAYHVLLRKNTAVHTASSRNTLTDHFLVEPKSNVKLFDMPYIQRVYDVYHRSWGAQKTHETLIPFIVSTQVAMAAHVTIGETGGVPVSAAFPLVAAMSAWYAYFGKNVAESLVPKLFAFTVLSEALVRTTNGESLPYVVGASVLLSFVQALSHACEDVPPPWTGSDKFEAFGKWFKRSTWFEKIGLFSIVIPGTFEEWWGSPRNWAALADRK